MRRADWTGDRVWTLPLAIELPDAVGPRWVDAPEGRYEERQALAVLFEELSISVVPATRVVAPLAGAAR